MRAAKGTVAGAAVVLFLGGALVSAIAPDRWPLLPPSAPDLAGRDAGADGAEGSLGLHEAAARILRCRSHPAGLQSSCATVAYLWSELMPLSAAGISEVRQAAARLNVELLVIDGAELERGDAAPSRAELVRQEMIAAGATLHYPSLLVFRAGRPSGAAILGYKTEAAYRTMIQQRLRDSGALMRRPATWTAAPAADSLELSLEFPVPGRPGAYFRSVAGRRTLAFEAAGTVYLLDLADGSMAVAPGTIDFVPSPDGRLFVTPGRNRGGLEFYDADEVFARASLGAGDRVEPIHVDGELRDQYPSVGILARDSTGADARTVYRVLTSWFDRIAFRDYEVVRQGPAGRLSVRPLGGRRFACPRVSIPILSPDGQYLAGRDEVSATTKIFRIEEGDGCREVADLGVQSGKVAWSPDADRLAFAIPRGAVRDGSGTLWTGRDDAGMAGIFVYDRGRREMRLIPGSEDANRLSFPEFVGPDSLVFLLTPESRRAPSFFRLVCCVR